MSCVWRCSAFLLSDRQNISISSAIYTYSLAVGPMTKASTAMILPFHQINPHLQSKILTAIFLKPEITPLHPCNRSERRLISLLLCRHLLTPRRGFLLVHLSFFGHILSVASAFLLLTDYIDESV